MRELTLQEYAAIRLVGVVPCTTYNAEGYTRHLDKRDPKLYKFAFIIIENLVSIYWIHHIKDYLCS